MSRWCLRHLISGCFLRMPSDEQGASTRIVSKILFFERVLYGITEYSQACICNGFQPPYFIVHGDECCTRADFPYLMGFCSQSRAGVQYAGAFLRSYGESHKLRHFVLNADEAFGRRVRSSIQAQAFERRGLIPKATLPLFLYPLHGDVIPRRRGIFYRG